jgi:hypothetical protein
MTNPPPPPPLEPMVHQYTVLANRDNDPPGHATYTLLQDGKPVSTNFVGVPGGWDDTTPWANQNDTAAYHALHGVPGVPSWILSIPHRTGILLHTDYGNPSSKTSVGCLVAPPDLLNELSRLINANKAAVQNYNELELPAYLSGSADSFASPS